MQDDERSEMMDPSRYGDARCGRRCRDRYEYDDKKEYYFIDRQVVGKVINQEQKI